MLELNRRVNITYTRTASAGNRLPPSLGAGPKLTSSWAHLAAQDSFLANIMRPVLVDCCIVIVVCNEMELGVDMNNNNARRFERHCSKDLELSPLRVGAVATSTSRILFGHMSK
jgi:hypothetical protein